MKWPKPAWIAFAFVALGMALYAHTLTNEFVFDDEEQIVNNSVIHDLANWPLLFQSSSMNQTGSVKPSGMYYKPVMTLAYMIIWNLFGDNPAPFRILQITLHALNSFLLYLLLTGFAPFGLSLGLGLLFLVHPINTEAAIYLANLQDVSFVFFGMMALLLLRKGSNWYLVSLFLLLSLLSKETGLAFWGMVGVWGWFNRPKFGLSTAKILMAVAACYSILRFGIADLTTIKHGVAPISLASFYERLLTWPSTWTHYFGLVLWPDRLTTTQNWVIRSWTWVDVGMPLIIICLVAAGYATSRARLRKSYPDLAFWFKFFGLWALGGLMIHSQIVAPLDGTVADRWFYFPMMGLCGLIACLLTPAWPKLKRYWPAFVLVLIPLSVRSHVRGSDWKNGMTLYQHDLALLPESYDLQNNLGVELFRASNPQAALEHFQKSVELAPHWTINWNNLGAAFETLGQSEKALDSYCKSIRNGVYYVAFENYPALLIKMGRFQEALDFVFYLGLPHLPNHATLLKIREYLISSQKMQPSSPPKFACSIKGL